MRHVNQTKTAHGDSQWRQKVTQTWLKKRRETRPISLKVLFVENYPTAKVSRGGLESSTC